MHEDNRFWRGAGLALLAVGILLPPVLPEAANIGFIGLAFVGLASLVARRDFHLLLRLPVLLPLVATAIVALALAMTASGPAGYTPLLILAPFWLVAPAASLFIAARVGPEQIGVAAVTATTAALALAIFDAYVVGTGRAGSMVNNPIHFAAVTIAIGFIALVGLQSEKTWLRRIAPLGPVFAILAVWLSASRGPLLAVPALCLTSLLVLSFIRLPRRWAWITTTCALLIVAVTGAWLWSYPGAVRIPAVGEVIAYLRDGITADHSIATRAVMYESGVRAFFASPWHGHGAAFFDIVGTFVPEGVSYPPFDHLHSDIIDFAAMAGLLGLVAYSLLLLAGPAALGRRSDNRAATALIIIPMVIGYAVMGLTNAMIGILTQTVLLATTLALVTALTTAQASTPAPRSRPWIRSTGSAPDDTLGG